MGAKYSCNVLCKSCSSLMVLTTLLLVLQQLGAIHVSAGNDITDFPRNCLELWEYHNVRTTGNYQIDPDGQGPLENFWVYCEMNANDTSIGRVVTVVHHDSEDVISIRGAEAPGSYVKNISYNGTTEEQLGALIDSATNCEQYIKWECKGAMFGFWYPLEVDSWWVGRNWIRQLYWGGAQTDSKTCGCHPYCKLTERNSTCNCDANDKLAWLEDEGLLLDRSRLPVLQLRFGDTGQANEAGKHTLGALRCIHDSQEDEFMGSFTAPCTITSPGFPSKYPRPFRRFHWTISIPNGEIFELVFPVYDVIFYGSYLSVSGCNTSMRITAERQSDGRVDIIESRDRLPPYYITDGSETSITIIHITCNQYKVNAQGFKAEFRKAECPGCDAAIGPIEGDTFCNLTCGIIASHRYPFPYHYYEYGNTFNQTWHISVPRGHYVKMSFNDFDIPIIPGDKECNSEVAILIVYKLGRNSSEIKRREYCNLNKQGVLKSRGSKMKLVYTGKYKYVGNGRGFHATFNSIQKRSVSWNGGNRELANVAKGKPTRQSSTMESYGSHLAVDGNTNQIFASGSCISTNFEKEPWWRVDLQKQHIIERVKIFNRISIKNSGIKEKIPWPKGLYGLPMPRSGCPASRNFKWETGMRYHDISYPIVQDEKMMHWSEGSHLQGGLQDHRGVEQHFCIKATDEDPTPTFESPNFDSNGVTSDADTETENIDFGGGAYFGGAFTSTSASTSTENWMSGHYCIYKYGPTCPSGFEEGSIEWRDYSSENGVNGTLPSGYYEDHTQIFFCCRADGDPEDPIILPTDQPFYLLQYGEDCQKVDNMNNLQQYFHFLEEDETHVSLDSLRFKPPHPKIDVILFEKGFTLYYCYYDITASLRGFRVVVDSHGLGATIGHFHDDQQFGIRHSVESKFGNSFTCIHYPVGQDEFSQHEEACVQPVTGQFVTLYLYDRYDILQLCEVEIYGRETCGQPLGMAAGEITDAQITASSSEDKAEHYHTNARLNHRNSWCANHDDEKHYLQVDLGVPTQITGICQQRLNQATKLVYIQNFTLTFSNDTDVWIFEEEPIGQQKVYQCEQCSTKRQKLDLIITYNLLRHFVARYVRMTVVGYEEAPCTRIEIVGCSSKDTCGENLTDSTGALGSPNYPFYYGQDRLCMWKITPPSGKHVELLFVLFELAKPENRAGSCRDSLTVSLGQDSSQIKSYHGKAFPKSLISNGTMTLVLKSCFRYTISRERGFYAKYFFTDCPGCGVGDYTCADKHHCMSPCGYIKSINHPMPYESNHRCRWLIHAPERHYIRVSFEDFDVDGGKNCDEDFVDFYDGEVNSKENLIGRYCNSSMPPLVILSSWNTMLVEFSSDASETPGRGFLLKYTSDRYELPVPLQELTIDDHQYCKDGWKHYSGYCYYFSVREEALQWDTAEALCGEQGGHLVSILDKMEMAFVHHLLLNIYEAYKKRVYIGLADRLEEGTFRWKDGNPMSYTDWSKAKTNDDFPQPDGGPYEDCTMIKLDNLHSTDNWHDVPCSLGKEEGVEAYMCKVKSQHTENQASVIWRESLTSNTDWATKRPHVIGEHRYFICKSFEVISILYVCDGKHDCSDGSDESKCGPPASDASFTCNNGTIISISKFCDFEDDCRDKSDENGCIKRGCAPGEKSCKNGQCVHKTQWCDLRIDCKDGSDELNCSGKCSPSNTFQCYDGKCIPKRAYCDGSFDCPGSYHEDEFKTCSKGELSTDTELQDSSVKFRRTCYELYILDNINTSGVYKIDVDGKGPMLPFQVECDIDTENQSATTVVHHDSEDSIFTHGEIEIQSNYRRDVVYHRGSWRQLRALTEISAQCRQYVKWECSAVGFNYDKETPITWCVSRDGEPFNSVGYSLKNLSICTCGCYPTCSPSLCNADAAFPDDSGYLTDKEKLPIGEVIFGRDTVRAVNHTIGPLECSGGDIDQSGLNDHQNVSVLRCHDGNFVNSSVMCIYNFDEYGYVTGCRDVTHLRNCEDFVCPIHHLKCPKSYCIPLRFVCNGIKECPGGYDEENCDNFTCSGHFRCRGSKYCLPLHELCDGIPQCKERDDEALCDIPCPNQCICTGLHVACRKQALTKVPVDLSRGTRKLDLRHNFLLESSLDFQEFPFIAELCLAYNNLTVLTRHLFVGLDNLYLLDISHNNLVRIKSEAFHGLTRLTTLRLDGNIKLDTLEPSAFHGLIALEKITISKTRIRMLQKDTFLGLQSLLMLNLTDNQIDTVEDGAFFGLGEAQILDIRGNKMQEFSKMMFEGLGKMNQLYSDSFKFCCLANPQVPFEDCLPKADEFSSCKDLMSNSILRMFLWFLGIIALIGNLVVIVWRSRARDVNKVSSKLILSLGCADLVMGIYLLIIASVDAHYRGHYIAYSDHWRQSVLCKIAGFLSTISSEVSVFTLTIITLDRLACIACPLGTYRFTLRAAYGLIAGSWLIAALLALMPFFVKFYFRDEFYARSGVCLALHITNRKPAGWEYSVAVFFCVNFVAFLVIIASYFYMYFTIRRASRYVNRFQARKSGDIKVGRQMALIVLTNCCCWMPIIMMGLCAMVGSTIPGEVYAWTAVFILPLNSATNPIIYTLSSVQFKKMVKRKKSYALRRTLSASQVQSLQVNHRAKNGGRYSWSYRPPKGYTSLMHFLRTRYPLHVVDVLDIARGICQALEELHSSGYALGGFEMDYIFVYKADAGPINVYLPDINAYQIGSMSVNRHTEDTAKDIEDFGKIVKKMLQIYHVTGKHGCVKTSVC